jgi:homoserine kinase
MTFVTGPVTVRAPASSANLGPGYDSFGLALSRYDEVTATVTGGGLQVSTAGCGGGEVPADERHLVVRAMRAAFDRLAGQPPGLRISCRNTNPHGRGLGSSAAAIVSGIALARALVDDGDAVLDDAAALALATELEGHPDNVAACLLGGATVAWLAGDGAGRAVRLSPVGVLPVLLVPADRSATQAARAVLPTTVPHTDAAFNAGRAGLLVLALTGRPDLLFTATEDRLHQQYRASSMPGTATLVDRLRGAGLAATVSGAGPSVLVLATGQPQLAQVAALAPAGWECAVLQPSDGASTVPG